MLHRGFLVRCLFVILVACLWVLAPIVSAQAAEIDPYITRYLSAGEPVSIQVDAQGNTRSFSGEDLSEGKRLFKESCLNCHVGGSTLPDPTISLSLADLKAATPRRDTLDGLVDYMRHPMTYDGTMETYWCREVPETWMPTEKIEKLAAFILRAAEKSPGWGKQSVIE